MASLQSFSGQSPPKNKLGSSLLSQSSYNLRGSPSKFRPKKKKMTQMTLVKRGLFRITDSEGVDRTPKLLFDPYYQILEEWQPTVLDFVDADLTSTTSQMSLQRGLQPTSGTLGYGSRQQHSVSLQMSFTNIANVDSYRETTRTFDGDIASDTRSEDRTSETPPSIFRLRDQPSREFYPPHSKVPLLARETDSFTLFSMQSVVQSAHAENAVALKKENEFYESITVGKKRYTRKLNAADQQTPEHINTSETSYCSKTPTKNASSWITTWKLYDEDLGISEDKKDYSGIPLEDQWIQLAEDEKYYNVSLIMERLLQTAHKEILLTYKRSLRLDPLDLQINFTYSAQVLWVYENVFVQNKTVTAIAVNSLCPEIIAVGHGKFFYQESNKGFVSIWSVKNSKNPERFYKFAASVKCLDFATWTPNLLATGFLNGDLLILDVSSFEKKIIFKKDSVACGTYEKVIFTSWWICKDIFEKEEERLMITTGDGRIIQFRRRLDNLVPFQMMRLTKLEGKVKGIDCLPRCEAEEITMLRFPAARCVVRYPNDHQFYLVSADDGTVHKCSTNFFTQHVESFLAHIGHVYALKFSPFCNKIYLTCGADGAVRLWVWDIFEPVITLTMGTYAVEDAAWSPRNSTIIASISEHYLYLWDLRRKTYHPASTITHPERVKFSSLQFTKTGDNILLGDVHGRVYVMALSGMPFEEKYKEEVLAASIEKELVVKPKILKMLKKSGPPFS